MVKNSGKFDLQMEVDVAKGEGFRNYYIQKIEELQLIVNEKSQNLRRLQAQRNELNAKGRLKLKFPKITFHHHFVHVVNSSSLASRGTSIAAGARKLCW
jgi:hypothetical protein